MDYLNTNVTLVNTVIKVMRSLIHALRSPSQRIDHCSFFPKIDCTPGACDAQSAPWQATAWVESPITIYILKT